jgi:hypothetical protein
LFLLVADGLSAILKHNETIGLFERMKVYRRAPGVSHLLFADDSLLFFRANVQQAHTIKCSIATFERCTGQLLSPSKCSMLVNEDLDQSISDQVRAVLGVERVHFEAKYLGLPTPSGRLRRGTFQPLEERLHKRLVAWKEKYLSAAGKEVLIKQKYETTTGWASSPYLLASISY